MFCTRGCASGITTYATVHTLMLTYKNRNTDVAVLFVARLLAARCWTDGKNNTSSEDYTAISNRALVRTVERKRRSKPPISNGYITVNSLTNFDFEVCHPRCVLEIYGEVNSVKNTGTNMWLNGGVYWQCKNYMFRSIAAIMF